MRRILVGWVCLAIWAGCRQADEPAEASVAPPPSSPEPLAKPGMVKIPLRGCTIRGEPHSLNLTVTCPDGGVHTIIQKPQP